MSTMTSGAANTAGSYHNIIDPTTADASGIFLHIDTNAMTGATAAVTFAIGNVGSTPLVNNIVVGAGQITTHYWPLSIRQGEGLNVKGQSTAATDTIRAAVLSVDDGSMGLMTGSAVDTIGFNAANTRGTTLDPGGTANTKPGYTQLTASTANDYIGICFAFDAQGKTSGTENAQFVDIATGAAGGESAFIVNWPLLLSGGTLMQDAITPWFYMSIKAGTRLAARSQSTINTTPQRLIGITAYGLRG